MTTVDVTAMPGLCRCGEVASRDHACEFQPPARRQLLVCPVCHEFTPDPNLCEHRLPEPPPMPENGTVTVWRRGCGHLDDDDCGCLLVGTATYARLR